MNKNKFTPLDIAEWMFAKIKENEELYQEEVVEEIISRFGEEFSYENENGNNAIDRSVLKHFRNLTEDTVVWEKSERKWRLRSDFDEPGRAQF